MFETIRCALRRVFLEHEQALKINYPGLNYQIYLREFLSFLGEGKKAEHIVDFSIEQNLIDFSKLSQKGVPFEYILEQAHFYGRDFVVGPGVLIPRQETEIMIEEVVKIKNQLPQKIDVLDLCSGSGCIGLTIACELAEQVNKLLMTDISKTALEFSELNASKLEYHSSPKTSISFVQSDLFKKITMKFHLIVSNPPYIKKRSHVNLVHEQVISFEPHEALFLDDSLYHDFFLRLYKGVRDNLHPRGTFLMEGHEHEIENLASLWRQENSDDLVEILKDLTNRDRFIKVTKDGING
jgi:release factor glutamine methyltransferase